MNPTYRDAIAVLTELTTALEVAEEKEKKLKKGVEENELPIEEQELDVSTLSDAWSRYAENMKNATDKNIKMKESLNILNTGLDEQQTAIREWNRSIQDASGNVIENMDEVIAKAKGMGETFKRTADDYFNAFNTALSGITAASNQHFTNESLKIENDFQEKKDAIMQNITNEEEQKDALARLDEETDRNRRELARNQAKAQKSASLIQAIINTAEGITKAWAQGGIFGVILAAVVAAAGLAQIGLISSQPLPALQEGGIAVRDTLAQIGEGGQPEAIIPLSSDALKPFAQAIVGEIGKLQAPGSPNIAMGNNVFNIQIGSEPIIRVIQKGFDNKQLRANIKTIR